MKLLEDFIRILIYGAVTGSVYAILGLGYNVIYSTTKVFNLAQGEFIMLGMMLGLVFLETLSFPLPLVLLLVILCVSAIGVFEERIAVRPIMGHTGALPWVMTTLSFAIIVRSIAQIVWGTQAYRVPAIVPAQPFYISDIRFSPVELSVIGYALLMAVCLHLFFNYTIWGKALRAVAHDREAASLRGINITLMNSLSFVIGTSVAALGGLLFAPISFAYVHIGMLYTFKGFIAVSIGGIGNNKGAIFGGLLLGIVEVFGMNMLGAGYRNIIALVFILVFLLVRPTGLFGERQLREV